MVCGTRSTRDSSSTPRNCLNCLNRIRSVSIHEPLIVYWSAFCMTVAYVSAGSQCLFTAESNVNFVRP